MIDTTANLVISKSNEVFLKVRTEPHIEYELRDHFKFEVPNAKFMPQYRGRNWNGEIHLFDMRSKQIYVGLLDKIVQFCDHYGYTYKFEDNKFYGTPFEENENISMEGVKDYMNSICSHTPRKYQIEGVYGALKHNRKAIDKAHCFRQIFDDLLSCKILCRPRRKNPFSCSNDIPCRADVQGFS